MPTIGDKVQISVETEFVAQNISIVEQEADPIQRLVQLTFIQEVLDQAMTKARAEVLELPDLRDRFKTHGVMISIKPAENAWIYSNNANYRALMGQVKELKKTLRTNKEVRFYPDRKQITVFLAGAVDPPKHIEKFLE